MKHRKIKSTCYMCERPATSREHVPPRCLFPEAKDVGGRNYRINLVTVPSCERHNAEKNEDDEFLMMSLAGIIGNNSIGYQHRFAKVERATRGNAANLLNAILRDTKSVDRFDSTATSNEFIEVIWGTPDFARLTRCFEHVAFGLHRHHFRERFSGRIQVHLGYIAWETPNAQAWNAFIRDRAAIDLEGKLRLGSNQDVFWYQMTDADQFGLYLARLCFYGGLDVYAGFAPSEAKYPENLATALIANGIRTVITLGDRFYEFNAESADGAPNQKT
jgi:hypothetical protein